jgi:hypothetical protein
MIARQREIADHRIDIDVLTIVRVARLEHPARQSGQSNNSSSNIRTACGEGNRVSLAPLAGRGCRRRVRGVSLLPHRRLRHSPTRNEARTDLELTEHRPFRRCVARCATWWHTAVRTSTDTRPHGKRSRRGTSSRQRITPSTRTSSASTRSARVRKPRRSRPATSLSCLTRKRSQKSSRMRRDRDTFTCERIRIAS